MRNRTPALNELQEEQIEKLFYSTHNNTVREISEKLNISKSQVSSCIDRFLANKKIA